MNILNIEIKVKCEHPEKIEKILIENHARFIGEDHQIDTYFQVDEVNELGSFVEIEAIDETGEIGEKRLKDQCNKYIKLLELTDSEFLDKSHSDILQNTKTS